MQHSDKPSMGNVKHSPKDKFVLNDVSKEELEKAIEQYNSRDRRYGGIKEDEENV